MKKKPPLRHISNGTGIFLSGKIRQELELETKLWTKVEPESEPTINNFGSATLRKNRYHFKN